MNSDENGHGTLVAGVIAATPNNFRGIAGAAFTVTLMPLKALDATGSAIHQMLQQQLFGLQTTVQYHQHVFGWCWFCK